MDFSFLGDFLTNGVELAKNITGMLGEFEASGILTQVGAFLKTVNFDALGNFLTQILGFLGQIFG